MKLSDVSRSESGSVGVAVLHDAPQGAAGRAAEGARLPGGVALPHAVRRVCKGLAAPQQLHGLCPQGEATDSAAGDCQTKTFSHQFTPSILIVENSHFTVYFYIYEEGSTETKRHLAK